MFLLEFAVRVTVLLRAEIINLFLLLKKWGSSFFPGLLVYLIQLRNIRQHFWGRSENTLEKKEPNRSIR